jgi:hypothetical protein
MMAKGHTRFSIGLSLLLAAMSVSAQPRIYKWVDADGVVHFSDEPPDDTEGVTAETLVIPSSAPQVGADRPVTGAPVEFTAAVEADVAQGQDPATASAPVQVQGRDCSSPSPRKQSGQDLYALSDERPEPLPTEEIESFETVIKGMVGRWSGTDVGFSCDGEASGRPANRAVTSEGRAGSRSEFVLDSTISSRDRNQRELLRIELRDQRLWVNHRYASLISVSDRVLEFGYGQRTGGAITPTGGIITELYWRIELDGRRDMRIEHVLWANGTLSENRAWELRKPF